MAANPSSPTQSAWTVLFFVVKFVLVSVAIPDANPETKATGGGELITLGPHFIPTESRGRR